MFLGLLTLSVGELESQLNQLSRETLLWRWMGWTFLFYIPIMWTATPFIRNYAIWGLQPCQSFGDAYRNHEKKDDSKCLRVLRSSRFYSDESVRLFFFLMLNVLYDSGLIFPKPKDFLNQFKSHV